MIYFDPIEYPDLDAMTLEQLQACREETQQQLAALDAQEPADMESEAYEIWGDAHEMLEDILDDIQDRLDALQ
ncbi:MAG: hypothetical protein E7470_05990 [Ruminococcaceae bacterium]|nr:hypothetical protein [Oscillospiraceae bacterium]